MQPTRTQVHPVNQILTNISVAYIQRSMDFIAGHVFPIVRVQKQSDNYFVYTKNDWFRDEAGRRADASESAGSGYNLGTDSYSCDVWAMHKDVGEQVRANADAPLNLDRDATQFVTQRLMLRREIQWVTDYFTTTVWGKDYTGVASAPAANQFVYWSDYANSDPIQDIETGKAYTLSITGFLPNTMVLGYDVFRQLKHHPDIVDRVKYTSAENITERILARLFELDNVYVAKAVKATNAEGGTAAYSMTHGSHAWLGYVNPQPSLLAPSAGYIFIWDGISGSMGTEIGIKSFRMENLAADRIEGQVAFDDKVVASDLGTFFSGATS